MHRLFRLTQVAAIAAGISLFPVPARAVPAQKLLVGQDRLSVPTVEIAAGTRIVGGGTGLLVQPESIQFEVPVDASIEQVLAYWNGFHSLEDNGDPTLVLNGVTVTGELIGGPRLFFSSNYSSTYRADITSLGLVQRGSNTLSVHGADFDQIANGASVVAIVTDSQPGAVDLRDGQDLVYANFADPLNASVPQTFSFDPVGHPRVADLLIAAGSVQGPVSHDAEARPNEMRLTIGDEVTVFPYFLGSSSGHEWDHLSMAVEIPAGVSTLTVELASTRDETTAKPASFVWSLAALRWPLAYCGDGHVDATLGELCDDGNTVNGDGCQDDCRPTPFCGDGVVNQAGETCDVPGAGSGDSDDCRNDCTYCGDAVLQVQGGEACDDGNNAPGDGCDADCRVEAFCGDGQTNPGEECDDGNGIDDDLCGNDCRGNFCGDGQANAGEQCDDGNDVDDDLCGNDCRANFCGDGQTNPGEECDDGNGIDDDLCGNDCRGNFCGDGQANAGEQCDDGNDVDDDLCGNDCRANFCGDGQINPGEECDDGNGIDDDLCGNDCRGNFCGDGQANAGEQCDDGNDVDDDLCGNDCRANFCGDGQTNPGEECDDGNGIDDDLCGNDCRGNFCGDGQANAGEQCDDGNDVDDDLCGNDCRANFCGDGQTNPGEECDDGNGIDDDLCGNDCRANFCGDGQVGAGEECDDGNQSAGDGCDASCRTESGGCGDGVLDSAAGEECDDGNLISGDGCDASCRTESGTCGDGMLDAAAGEECDDGNLISGDGCDASCRTESGTCGDGMLDAAAGEECDDGNQTSGDGCDASCRTESGTCGDGILDSVAGEECDDGNQTSGDGCDASCRTESGTCGDGILDAAAGEECDDGNLTSGDGCDASCRMESGTCGDGILDAAAGEECDDGNLTSGDGCDSSCRTESGTCGDGVLDSAAGEECDDGNSQNGDGCSSACRFEAVCGLALGARANPVVAPYTTRVGCGTMGLPEQLRFRYTGGSCAGRHEQGGQATCDGELAGGEPVAVLASGRSAKMGTGTTYVVVPSIVQPGETFTVYPAGAIFEEQLSFDLTSGGKTQALHLDTSCGLPLRNGDRFGAVTLVGYNKRDGTPAEVTFTYDLVNTGSRVEDIVVEDALMGMIATGLALDPGQERSFSRTTSVWSSATDAVSARGRLAATGGDCAADAKAEVTVEGQSGVCPDAFGRRPQLLALRYTGEGCAASAGAQGALGGAWDCQGNPGFGEPVRLVVADRPNPNDPAARIWFDGVVSALGDIVLVDAEAAGANQLGAQTYVGIWNHDSRRLAAQVIRFDTSCGQALSAGDQFGAIRVESVKLAY